MAFDDGLNDSLRAALNDKGDVELRLIAEQIARDVKTGGDPNAILTEAQFALGLSVEDVKAVEAELAKLAGVALEKTAADKSQYSPEAREFISKKIKKLRDEGKPQDQAEAIALSMAREKGLKAPEKKDAAATYCPDCKLPMGECKCEYQRDATLHAEAGLKSTLNKLRRQLKKMDAEDVDGINKLISAIEGVERELEKKEKAKAEKAKKKEEAAAESAEPKSAEASVSKRAYDRYQPEFEELINQVVDALKNDYSRGDWQDNIHEAVDNAVPVYNKDIIKLVSSEPKLWNRDADVIAFDGTPTPVNVCAGAIYSELMEAVSERMSAGGSDEGGGGGDEPKPGPEPKSPEPPRKASSLNRRALPRGHSIQVYRFDELSPEAKQRAKDDYFAAHGYSWGDEAIDSLKALAKYFGGKLSDYSIDFWRTSHSSAEFDMPEMSREEIAERMQGLGAADPKTGKGMGDCTLTGYCADEDAIDGFRAAFNAGESDLNALMQAAFETWLEDAQSDAEASAEDENFSELSDGNDWEYTEDGRFFTGGRKSASFLARKAADGPAESFESAKCAECGGEMGAAYFMDDLGICTKCVKKKHRDVAEPGWRKRRAADEKPKATDKPKEPAPAAKSAPNPEVPPAHEPPEQPGKPLPSGDEMIQTRIDLQRAEEKVQSILQPIVTQLEEMRAKMEAIHDVVALRERKDAEASMLMEWMRTIEGNIQLVEQAGQKYQVLLSEAARYPKPEMLNRIEAKFEQYATKNEDWAKKALSVINGFKGIESLWTQRAPAVKFGPTPKTKEKEQHRKLPESSPKRSAFHIEADFAEQVDAVETRLSKALDSLTDGLAQMMDFLDVSDMELSDQSA